MESFEIRDLKDKILDSLDNELKSMVDKMASELISVDNDELCAVVVDSIAHHVAIHLSYYVNMKIDFDK